MTEVFVRSVGWLPRSTVVSVVRTWVVPSISLTTGFPLASRTVSVIELGAEYGGSGKLRLWRAGDAIVCEVSDDGPGITMPHQVGTKPVPLNYDGGRGLWLVRHFTDHVEIVNRDPGTTVTISMAIR